MEWITSPEIWISLLTLTVLEIVLGIDNIVFISILAGKLPKEQQAKARQTGLMLALITRILLLCGLAFMVKLTKPLFEIPTLGILDEPHPVSGRDLILIFGGLFLLWKSTHEIHDKLEGEDGEVTSRVAPKFAAVIVQILLLDIVFSLDSVITAVGMAKHLGVMIAAVIIALVFMLFFAGHDQRFHPQASVAEDAGVEFPAADRLRAGGGRFPQGNPEGLHLLRDGVLGRRGEPEHPDAHQEKARAGGIAPAVSLRRRAARVTTPAAAS